MTRSRGSDARRTAVQSDTCPTDTENAVQLFEEMGLTEETDRGLVRREIASILEYLRRSSPNETFDEEGIGVATTDDGRASVTRNLCATNG